MVKISAKFIDPWPAAEAPIIIVIVRIVLIHVDIVIVTIRIERNTGFVDEVCPYMHLQSQPQIHVLVCFSTPSWRGKLHSNLRVYFFFNALFRLLVSFKTFL